MTAILQLQFGEVLTESEVHELTEVAVREKKPLERVILEAVRNLVATKKGKSVTSKREGAGA